MHRNIPTTSSAQNKSLWSTVADFIPYVTINNIPDCDKLGSMLILKVPENLISYQTNREQMLHDIGLTLFVLIRSNPELKKIPLNVSRFQNYIYIFGKDGNEDVTRATLIQVWSSLMEILKTMDFDEQFTPPKSYQFIDDHGPLKICSCCIRNYPFIDALLNTPPQKAINPYTGKEVLVRKSTPPAQEAMQPQVESPPPGMQQQLLTQAVTGYPSTQNLGDLNLTGYQENQGNPHFQLAQELHYWPPVTNINPLANQTSLQLPTYYIEMNPVSLQGSITSQYLSAPSTSSEQPLLPLPPMNSNQPPSSFSSISLPPISTVGLQQHAMLGQQSDALRQQGDKRGNSKKRKNEL